MCSFLSGVVPCHAAREMCFVHFGSRLIGAGLLSGEHTVRGQLAIAKLGRMHFTLYTGYVREEPVQNGKFAKTPNNANPLRTNRY